MLPTRASETTGEGTRAPHFFPNLIAVSCMDRWCAEYASSQRRNASKACAAAIKPKVAVTGVAVP